MSKHLEKYSNELPLGKGVSVLAAHAEGLIALHKPVDVLSHPNRKDDISKSLITARYDEEHECFVDLEEGCPHEKIYLLNRLDSATSGVILISLRKDIAVAVREQFEKHRVEKIYYALLRGRLPTVADTWVDSLEKRRSSGGSKIQVSSGMSNRKQAKTRVHCLRSDENNLGLSLVKLMPQTGRTHQLRYQCQRHRSPILGDGKYGDYSFNRRIRKITQEKRLFLHAQKVELRVFVKGKAIHLIAESPIPKAFDELLNFNAKYKTSSQMLSTGQIEGTNLLGPEARRSSSRSQSNRRSKSSSSSRSRSGSSRRGSSSSRRKR